jgi:hypothetical protein
LSQNRKFSEDTITEGGSYNLIVHMIPKESIPTSGNLILKISPGVKFDVYDMYNSYIRLEINLEITYTYSAAFGNFNSVMKIFLGNKHPANFFQQVRIYYNNTLLVKSLDFV